MNFLFSPPFSSLKCHIAGSAVSCGIWQFTCGSGDCIAGYDVCDGIPQCDDNSDESPENCPSKKNRAKQQHTITFQYLDELTVSLVPEPYHEIWQLKLPISCFSLCIPKIQ